MGQNAMLHFPEVTESYPIVPAGIPTAVGSDGRTSVEGVASTPTTPVPTFSTPTRAHVRHFADVPGVAQGRSIGGILDILAGGRLHDCLSFFGIVNLCPRDARLADELVMAVGDYETMENHYDPEHHDIWGDSEDDQRYQKAPVNADSMNLKQAAQLLTYNTIPINYEDDPTAIEFNSDSQIKDTWGRAPYPAADARRSGLRTERDWMPEDAPPRAKFASLPNGSQTAVRRPAPRPWHTTVRRNETTPWRPRPLCIIGLMTHIILLLVHNGDSGAEPCSPPANTTNLTTYQNTTTHHGLANGEAERCSPPTTPTATTVRSPAPRPCHHPNHTIHAMHDSATLLHQRLGIHLVLNITPLPSHIPQRSRTRNCRKTAFSHRSTPPSQPNLAWHCRSVIVSGAGPPVCLPATGSAKGIKHALHHLTPHLPPPHHQRLFYQGQPLGDQDPTPTATGPIHRTLRLVGLKGGGRRSRRDTDSDSTSDSDSDSYSRRKKSRKRSSKEELNQALRAMTSLADSVAGICRSIQQPQQTVTPEASAPQRSTD